MDRVTYQEKIQAIRERIAVMKERVRQKKEQLAKKKNDDTPASTPSDILSDGWSD